MERFLSKFLIKAILLYQQIAPSWIRNSCRYTPTCSQYAILTIKEKGPIKGSFIAILRIVRCIPPLGGEDWPEKSKEKGDNHVIKKLS